MAQFFSQYGPLLAEGVWESVYMTLATTALAYVLGLPMGVLLTVTKRGGIAAAPRFHAVFGWVVNILRSLPFLILMFFVIPFTRLVAGTSIGPTAALVPLTISASPFIARMVEQSLEEIDAGVVEAAECMGATKWQIVTRAVGRKRAQPAARAFHQRYHHFGLHRHHRCVRRRGPWQPGLPLWLPALSEGRDVCVHPSSYFAGVRCSNYLRPCGPQSG